MAAILLGTLTACGPSGPTTPEQPGSSTGTTEPSEPGKDPEYAKACTKLRNEKVQDKASIGFGAVYNGYPIDKTYRKWADSTNPVSAERNKALILSKDATFVGVGVAQNPDTTSEYKYMVVVMTY